VSVPTLDAAPVILKNVYVTGSEHNGIVLDWPKSTRISDVKYMFLSRSGHSLEDVTIEKSKDNGMYVFPGVRVVSSNCTFSDNGDAGAFFQGAEDEDKEKEEALRKRLKSYTPSVIHESTLRNNNGFGVESEENGLVELTGPFDFGKNKKGDMNKHVVSPAKSGLVLLLWFLKLSLRQVVMGTILAWPQKQVPSLQTVVQDRRRENKFMLTPLQK